MALPSSDQVHAVAERLVSRYLELGERAALNQGTLAQLAGVSRTQFGTYAKGKVGDIRALSFIRIKHAIGGIEQGLEEGWLPASALRGEGQSKALRRLQGDGD